MTNKLKYFIGNWKMFGNLASLKNIRQIHHFINTNKKIKKSSKIVLCVPNTLIYFYTNSGKLKLISIGGQNFNKNENYGPFTGSINAFMLKNVGAKYVILGHSENRLEGENNKIIKNKIESALKQNLKVIFCIGETFKDKSQKKTLSVIRKQIKESLSKKFNLNNIIIAYEPLWSIGSGKIPREEDLIKIFKYIKSEFKKIFKKRNDPVVLYGGSVNRSNISNFSSISEINGFLIGGASQSARKFVDIIKNYYK